MDVQLYVYDLSRGIARQMSQSLLGVHIDAVYHTSLVFGGVEYFFGHGVNTARPGSTHHGQPMEVIPMGKTEIDTETIIEYLDSLKEVYTPESYDLFMHNCNNFTNDFSMFLVGKGIPGHITSLPKRVLDTPFGQMLRPQIEQAMSGVTQAPIAPTLPSSSATKPKGSTESKVKNITDIERLQETLIAAENSCAAIFFTSATCPPCKICYPVYEELAEEHAGKAVLIKVDVSIAQQIGQAFSIRATPTFITFCKGSKLDQWSGADPNGLRGKVNMLVQMAYPPHPHSKLRLPNFQRPHETPVLYAKVPPLDKVLAKLGDKATHPSVVALKKFVETRQNSKTIADAALPDMSVISPFIKESAESMPPATLFALADVLRPALVDPRVSGYFAAEKDNQSSILALLKKTIELGEAAPYPLRIVSVQLACNIFSSKIYLQKLHGPLLSNLVSLVVSSLLDKEHEPIRIAASSLAYNLASINHAKRLRGADDVLSEESQVELAASLTESLERESSQDCLKGLFLAIGLLSYGCPAEGELKQLLGAMETKNTVQKKNVKDEKLKDQVLQILS